jgi:hypothetical protein
LILRFLEILIYVYTGLSHLPGPIEISSNSKAACHHRIIPTEYHDGHSDQSRGSHLPRLISNSDAVGVLPRNGQAIQFAVGTTVEFDRGFIDLNNTVSSHANVGDDSEEGGSYSEHKKKKNMEA